MNIDLSNFKVVYGERVIRAVSLINIIYDIADGKTSEKPKFIDLLVINSDGNLEILSDEAWRFQFIPVINP